nr:transposase [Hymenolepis microstoma]
MQNWRREVLSKDSCRHTQEELSVVISGQAISKRLKQLGMIEKEGYWVPHELKPRGDVERHLFACEQLVERQTRKGFLHRIVTGDETKSWGLSGGHTATSTPRPNVHGSKVMLCVWWHQLGVIYYELLKPSETITDIAPSDFHFNHLAQWHTADQHFSSYEEVKNWIDSWILSKDERFVRLLPERWAKVVANDGQYFET